MTTLWQGGRKHVTSFWKGDSEICDKCDRGEVSVHTCVCHLHLS